MTQTVTILEVNGGLGKFKFANNNEDHHTNYSEDDEGIHAIDMERTDFIYPVYVPS